MVDGHADLMNKTFGPYLFADVETNYDCHATIINGLQQWLVEHSEDSLMRSDFLSQIEHYRIHYRTFLTRSLLLYAYRKMIMQKRIESHPLMWKLLKERKRERESVLYVDADEDAFDQVASFLEGRVINSIAIMVRTKRRVSRQFVKSLVYAVNYRDRVSSSQSGEGSFECLEDEWSFNRCASIKIVHIGIELVSPSRSKDFAAYTKMGVSIIQLVAGPGMIREDLRVVARLARASGLKVLIKIVVNKPGSSFVADMYRVDEHMSSALHQADEVVIAIENETASTVMEKWHNSPKYVPYAGETKMTLFTVMKYGLLSCPPWMRLRCEYGSQLEMVSVENFDILRVLTQEMEELGVSVHCIGRCIRAAEEAPPVAHFFTSKCIGDAESEYFISDQSEDHKALSAFIRLHVPSDGGLALIREMKIERPFARTKMLEIAEEVSKRHGGSGIAARCMGCEALLNAGFGNKEGRYTKRFGILTRLYYMLPNFGAILPD